MRNSRRFKHGPLFGFAILSLLGFIFFTISLVLLWIRSDCVDEFLRSKYKKGLSDFIMFIIPSAITAIGFLLTFFQLLFSKPSTKKVLVPIIVFTSVAFAILIALDFYLEFQLTHLPPPPKEVYTKTEPSHDEKKGKTRFKMGYLVIYVSMCIVVGFVYLGFKDLEEHLEKQTSENERQQEIIISHIT